MRVVDAMNVVGSRPDGWWRDRHGALERLIRQVEQWADGEGETVAVILERAPSPPIVSASVEVAWAPEAGPNAADAEIVRRLPAWLAADEEVIVVTSDRDLADRARALGAEVEGAGAFRRRLPSLD